MSHVMRRIREAASRASATALKDARHRPSLPREALMPPPLEAVPEDRLARFKGELEALSCKSHGPFGAEGVIDKVIELISARAATRVLAWTDVEIGCPGLGDRLRQASIELMAPHLPNCANRQKELEDLATLDFGLTGAIAGIADTGSIVVASGFGRLRIASLFPPTHIAILSVARVYPTMHDLLAQSGRQLVRETANVVVITGSSRTSDIELQLTLGMHGPKELHVILFQDSTNEEPLTGRHT